MRALEARCRHPVVAALLLQKRPAAEYATLTRLTTQRNGSGPRRRGDVLRRLRCRRPPDRLVSARRPRVADRRPDPLRPGRIVRHCPGRLHQLTGRQPMTPKNDAPRRIAHETVQRRVALQPLQLDHRSHKRRVIHGRGRHLRTRTADARDHRDRQENRQATRNHWLQRYRVASPHVNGSRCSSVLTTHTCRRHQCSRAPAIRRDPKCASESIGGYPIAGLRPRPRYTMWIMC